MTSGQERCGCCCMLRLMAVLVVCAVALLLQGAPVWAANSGGGLPIEAFCCDRITNAETVPLGQDDCLRGDGCCMAVCCCQAQLGAYFAVVERVTLECSPMRIPNGDFIRSVVLGRDPPIPRIRSFQAL